MQIISSKDNELVKHIKKLKDKEERRKKRIAKKRKKKQVWMVKLLV